MEIAAEMPKFALQIRFVSLLYMELWKLLRVTQV